MPDHKTEPLTVMHTASQAHPFLVTAADDVFAPQDWVRSTIKELPSGTRVRLLLQVMPPPMEDDWRLTEQELPAVDTWVQILRRQDVQRDYPYKILIDHQPSLAYIHDDIWVYGPSMVIFEPVVAWKPVQS